MRNKDFNTLLVLMVILLSGCSRAAYERYEERSLPRYQQGTPVMSAIEVKCRGITMFEPGDFKLSYNVLWDVTIYPTFPQIPPSYPPQLCINGESISTIIDPIHHNPQITEPSYNGFKKPGPNLDPLKGAVNAWGGDHLTLDGLNWKSNLIYFGIFIFEGDKLPLGGMLRGWTGVDGVFEKEIIIVNDKKWEHLGIKTTFSDEKSRGGITYTAGDISELLDIYKTKVGKYTVLVYGTFSSVVAKQPEWLKQRRDFLRQWVNSFKTEPLPPGYIKKTLTEIQQMRDEKAAALKAQRLEFEKNRRRNPIRLSAPVQGQ